MFAATILLADTTPAAATAAATVTPATVAAPAPVAAAPIPAAQVAKTEKPRMICRTDPVTGSLFPKKTCYAADDYARNQEEQRRNLEQMQSNRPIKSN